jgi:hypothetical protein
MTVTDWISQTTSYYQNHGPVEGTQYTAKNSLHSVLGRLDPHIGGFDIYDESWDLCIVIDACRADMFAEVAWEYDWLPDIDQIDTRRSVGGATRDWMRRTFTPERSDEMAATEYVLGNMYGELMLDEDEFRTLDKVYQYAWDDHYGTVQARPVTERAVATHRETESERLLVHYMQPHFPSVACYLGYNIDPESFEEMGEGVEWDSVWSALEQGDISEQDVWTAYRSNLRYVLDDIAILVQNIDAERAILTSDHGNAVGEWWTYGHPPGTYHPKTRRVPFVEVEASDEHTLEPTLEREESDWNESDDVVSERLAALGYT